MYIVESHQSLLLHCCVTSHSGLNLCRLSSLCDGHVFCFVLEMCFLEERNRREELARQKQMMDFFAKQQEMMKYVGVVHCFILLFFVVHSHKNK